MATPFLRVSLFLVSISIEIVLIQVDSGRLIEVCVLVAQSCLTLCDPMDYIVHQASLSMGFSRQEYWSGLPFEKVNEGKEEVGEGKKKNLNKTCL